GCRGFLIGGTAGRTTLAGEGLQHQDGHSHLLAIPYPHVRAYDPAFAYEVAVIIEEGMKRMFVHQENMIFYITTGNESYAMPPAPRPIEELRQPILDGMYRFSESKLKNEQARGRVQLLGSGALMPEVLEAARMLEADFNVAADIWSVTSYKQLFVDALNAGREEMLVGNDSKPYVARCLGDAQDAVVAVSDYVKMLPYSLSRWLRVPVLALGTDGFGRSESREGLRDWFEVDRRYIVVAALHSLVNAGKIDRNVVSQAIKDYGINPEKVNPMITHW
ncbi:MAG: pyruvate dehydrogenase (acetyl-transferring), homodimeric type, partial [Leptospiraceae bacterium]|nr:pyruvate dehydrogenase (acetyl-transferring), homodimeric type [Leptospiraceae bacterium]